MKVLVDTRVMLFALSHPEKLGTDVRALLEDSKNTVFVSAVSFWELAYKVQLKKVALRGVNLSDLPSAVEEMGWKILPLDVETAASFGEFGTQSNGLDIFERMLVWIALRNQLEFVTAEPLHREIPGLKVHPL